MKFNRLENSGRLCRTTPQSYLIQRGYGNGVFIQQFPAVMLNAACRVGGWLSALTPLCLHHGLHACRVGFRGQRQPSKSQVLAVGSLPICTEMSHAKGIRVGHHEHLLHTTHPWPRVDAKVCLLNDWMTMKTWTRTSIFVSRLEVPCRMEINSFFVNLTFKLNDAYRYGILSYASPGLY